jgi:serine/threonine-protein kinase RsbW
MTRPYDYVEMKFPAKPEYVGVIRLTLSGIANRMGFSYDEIEDLKIATSEACTNAVQHAYKLNEHGVMLIGFGLYEDRLEVIVADHGKSFDYQNVLEASGPYNQDNSVEFMREGGLGLYLIETLMDEVRIHHQEGVVVIMTKYIAGERVEMDASKIST